jgi:PLP dependent protein
MHPGSRSPLLDDQHQLTLPRQFLQASKVNCSWLPQNKKAGPSWEPRGGIERLLRNDEPFAGDTLAAGHGHSYSASQMSGAEKRRERILERIARAARLAGRDPAEIELIAVSKGRSAVEIETLIEVGQRDFGENRVQEAFSKWPALISNRPDIRLHAIGRLQSNKAADAIKLFDVIHSLDRRSLLDALVKEAEKAGRTPCVYIQVNIGEEEQKGGCSISELGELVDAVRESVLPLAGLMAIPPLGLEPAPYFALLAKLARRHDVTGLSIGMSSDFESAVMLGATAVRVGTAMFEDE